MAITMRDRETSDGYGRRVIHRAWFNTDGQLHRTTGPAVEHWTVLPGGAHVLSYQAWCQNGKDYREGRPAVRRWHVAGDGTRVLEREEWWRASMLHRSTGPAYRLWTVGPDGTWTLTWEHWRVNGKLHRVDGPAYPKNGFCWHGVEVRQEDLPWLRRGQGMLSAFTGAIQEGGGGSGVSPAWSRDARVAMTEVVSTSGTPRTYRSAVGGSVLLCV